MKPNLLNAIALIAALFILSNTTNAATYYWTGATNNNWNTASNWAMLSCGGTTATSTPGSGDSTVFSGSCLANCTINVSINVLSLRTDNTYSGTITQGSGNAITIAYCKFADGTFSGSSAAITISTSLTIEGGSFTTSSGTTTIEGNFSYTGGTFYPNNGRVVLYKTLTVSGVNSSSYINLYDVEFQAIAGNSTITLSNIYFNVIDSTLLTGSNQLFINASQTGSVIKANSNVKVYNTSTTGGGDGTIIMNGSSNQYLVNTSSIDDEGKLPNLTIDNTSGTVYLVGDITMGGSTTLTYTAGTINAGTSKVIFYYDNTTTGSMTFDNIEFQGSNSTCTVSNITANGDVAITGTSSMTINTGTISLQGSLSISDNSNNTGGSSTFNFTGSNNDSLIATSPVTLGDGYLPNITINKTGGTFYIVGIISIQGNWTNNYSQANINAGASTVYFNAGNYTIGGTYSTPLWNVEFGGGSVHTFTMGKDSAIIIKNNLIMTSTQYFNLNGYAINIYGNIMGDNTGGGEGGTTVLNLVGSANDSIIVPSNYTIGECFIPAITINKTGGTLYLSGIISVEGNWTNNYSQTNINSGTSTVYFNGGNYTIGGTYSTPMWNVEFGGGGVHTFTIAKDSAIVVKHSLIMGSTQYFYIDGYALNIYGNIVAGNTGGGDEGTTIFNLVGSNTDSIISPSGFTAGECYIPAVTINKTGGTLYLSGVISSGGNWRNDYSTANINPLSSTIFFNNSPSDTIGGSYTTPLWNAQFGAGATRTYYITADSALSIHHTLTLAGTGSTTFSGNSINLYGNVSIGNTSNSSGGTTTVFNFTGSSNDTITAVSGVNLSDGSLPAVTINKSSGTLYLSGLISVNGNWTYTNGTVNAGSSTVGFYGTNTITASQMSSYMSFNNLQIGGSTSTSTLASALNMSGRLTINGTLNTSSSNYQILIGNGWVNNGTYTGNNSNVTFNGSVNDSIKGSSNTTFYSLTMNKTGTVTLADPTTVTNALTLTNGDVLSSSTDLLTLNNGSSVSSANDNSFVNGPVKKIGNSAFTFPTGANNSYHPIGITAPSSTSDAFEAQYLYSPPAGRSYTDDSLTYVSTCDYWLLSHPAGSSSIIATLFWGTGSCNIMRLSSLRVGYYNISTHVWTNLGQSVNTGTTTSGSVTAITTSSISTTADTFAISKHSPTPAVNASSNTTICYGTSTTISSSPSGGFSPYTYSWSPSTGLSSSAVSNPTASPTTTSTYTVTVNDDDNAPTATGTVVVTVNPKLFVHVRPDTTIYFGQSDTLGCNPVVSGGASPYTYNWSISDSTISTIARPVVSPTLTTTYLLTATDASDCVAYGAVTVTVIPQLQASVCIKRGICEGQATLIGGSPPASGGTAPYTYSWSNGTVFSQAAYPTVSPSITTTYTFTVTDANSHTSTVYDTVTVFPSISTSLGSDITIIPGSSVTLNGSAVGGTSPIKYSWFPYTGLSSSSISNPTVSPQSSSVYTLLVMDTNGCNTMKSINVQLRFPSQGMASTFALLASDSLIVSSNDTVSGDAGATNFVSSSVNASNTYTGSSSTLTAALSDLGNEIDTISTLAGTTIGTINGTLTSGIYNVSGNTTLSDTLTFNGDSTSYFIINITGNLTINSNAAVQLSTKVNSSQVLIYAGGNVTISNPSYLQGRFIASGNITGSSIVSSAVTFQSLGKIHITHVKGGENMIPPETAFSGTYTLSPSSIVDPIGSYPNFLGFDINNIDQPDNNVNNAGGYNDPGFISTIPQMNSSIFRIEYVPHGNNNWDWNYGRFQGTEVNLYANTTPAPLNEPPLLSVFSPQTANQNFSYLSDKLTDGKLTFDGENAAPLFSFDMITNNMHYELRYLKTAYYLNLPIKYIELGNEYWAPADQAGDNGILYQRWPNAQDYVNEANAYLDSIHCTTCNPPLYPNAHVAVPAKFLEANVSVTNNTCRPTNWVAGYGLPNVCSTCTTALHLQNHDALSFHIYLGWPSNLTLSGGDGLPDPNGLPAFFAQPFDEVQYFTANGLPMCNNNGGITIDPWITEYNLDKVQSASINGTWAHGLLTAGMTLAFLEQPAIKHLICMTIARYADQAMAFVYSDGFTLEGALKPPVPVPNTNIWGLSASGTTMQLIGEAMRNCSTAVKIAFNPAPPPTLVNTNTGGTGQSYPVLYGWEFTSTSGEEQAIIINFDGASHNIDPTGILSGAIGYEQLSNPDYPLCYVLGSYPAPGSLGSYDAVYYPIVGGTVQEPIPTPLTHTGPETYSSSPLILPAYSITRIYLLQTTINITPSVTTSPINLSTMNSSGSTYMANGNTYTYKMGDGSPIKSTAVNFFAEGANTYTWTTNCTDQDCLSNPDASSVTFCPTTPSTSYTVTCTATGNCTSCAPTSSTINVSTINAPTITETSYKSGQQVSASAPSSDAYYYNWSPTEGIYTTNDNYSTVEGANVYANPLAIQTYTVTAMDISAGSNTGFFSINSVTVSQSSSPPTIVMVSPTTSVVCTGASIVLEEPTNSYATYSWENESTQQSLNTLITSVSGNTITFPATPPYNQYYPTGDDFISLTVTDGSGNTYKSLYQIIVSPNLSVDAPFNDICTGNCVTVVAEGAGSYSWAPSTSLSSTTGGSSISLCPTTTTTYSITGTTGSCSDINEFSIDVAGTDPTPSFSLSPPYTILNGCGITINATPSGSDYYYTWLPGTGLNNVVGATVVASPTTNTTYSVYEDNTDVNSVGCCGKTTVAVNVANLTMSPTTVSICNGQSTTLEATGVSDVTGGVTYTWSPSLGLNYTSGSSVIADPTATTTYTVTVSDQNNCQITGAVLVTVSPLPTVTTSPTSPVLISGCAVSLTASGASSYTWSPSSSLNSSVGSTVIATPTVTTSYTLIGTTNGCSTTSNITVDVISVPDIICGCEDNFDPCCAGDPIFTSLCDLPLELFNPYPTDISITWFQSSSESGPWTEESTGDFYGSTLASYYYYCQFTQDAGYSVNSAIYQISSEATCEEEDEVLKTHVSSDTSQIINSSFISIYPNPNNGTFTLQINTGDSSTFTATVHIINTIGALMYNNSIGLNNGMFQDNLYLNIPSGMYFITVYENQSALHSRFIVIH